MWTPDSAPRDFDNRPSVCAAVAELPDNFLGVDPNLLAAAARRRRSIADLVAARDDLYGGAGMIADKAASALDYRWEAERDVRSVVRGYSLAWDLMRSSVSGSKPDSANYMLDLIDLVPTKNGAREHIREITLELTSVRRGSLRADGPGVVPGKAIVFTELVGDVIVKSGLGGSFNEAVDNLVGQELLGTDLGDARYGAALVALATASVRGSLASS